MKEKPRRRLLTINASTIQKIRDRAEKGQLTATLFCVPDWEHWGAMHSVSLAEAAALSMNREPFTVPILQEEEEEMGDEAWGKWALTDDFWAFSEQNDGIASRTEIALSHARDGRLPCSRDADGNFFVTLGDFRALGESLPTPFTFPPEYPKATPKAETQKEVTQEKSGKIIKGNDKLFGSQDSIEPEENEEDAMRSNQRENLYCIIAALEKDASLTAKTLHIKMKRDGVEISERTIGRAFEEAKKVYKEKKSQSTNNK